MVGSSTANSKSFEVSTPSEQEIVLTRLFDAPMQLVFEVMTRPEHVRQWWGQLGDGYTVPVCEIDFRVGGKWRFVNRHPKGDAAFYGEYREIDAPKRVVFTEIFEPFPDTVSVVTSVLTQEGDGDGNGNQTRLTATVRYPSREVRDMVMATGMARGAGLSYDRMEDLLAKLQR
jgi:uncharacterized protein YndB with AHSA1/START domain